MRWYPLRGVLAIFLLWGWSGVLAVFFLSMGDRVWEFGGSFAGFSIVEALQELQHSNGFIVGIWALMLGVFFGITLVVIPVILSSGFIISFLLSGAPSLHHFRRLFPGVTPRFAINHPVFVITDAIQGCADAHSAGGEAKMLELSEVSGQLARVSRRLIRSHRSRGAMPWKSHRRAAVKEHAGRVIGRLRTVEQKLDRDPGPALAELGDLLLTIADRYAQGRLGALLDDDLSDVVPVRQRSGDAVRAALAVVLTVGAVFAVASLDLPQAIEGYAIAGAGAVILVTVYGPQVIAEFRRRR
ncbi:hypothetical protein [Streptomyces sp. NEAU-S7GS2]|uniref:hypothetical protein n=1 Tax=Streptomyces sp. NEAU-S7GS2 TaxID=2202000 RepID=UPI0013A53C83|nr:hypothetical protein [Streptomyces sp. NEAU-S7GS2]